MSSSHGLLTDETWKCRPDPGSNFFPPIRLLFNFHGTFFSSSLLSLLLFYKQACKPGSYAGSGLMRMFGEPIMGSSHGVGGKVSLFQPHHSKLSIKICVEVRARWGERQAPDTIRDIDTNPPGILHSANWIWSEPDDEDEDGTLPQQVICAKELGELLICMLTFQIYKATKIFSTGRIFQHISRRGSKESLE